jgi:hypothetical protein
MGKYGLKRGEHTPEGQARCLANLEAPGEAHLKHQAHRFMDRGLWPVCSRCPVREQCERFDAHGTCVVAAEAQVAVMRQVMALPHVRPEDAPIADEYARLTVFVNVLDLYLSRHGALLGNGDAPFCEGQPVLAQRAKFSKLRLEHARELGLTPAARKRLEQEHQADGAVAVIAELRARYTDAPVIDGEVSDGQGEGADAAGEVS